MKLIREENKYLQHSVLIVLFRQKGGKQKKVKKEEKFKEKNILKIEPNTNKCHCNQCKGGKYETIIYLSVQINIAKQRKLK